MAELIGYKKIFVRTNTGQLIDAICTLRITGEHNEARTNVCNPARAKYRCSEAYVVSITRRSSSSKKIYKYKSGISAFSDVFRPSLMYFSPFRYHTGSTVKPEMPYNCDMEVACASGIHYFKTKQAAEEYGGAVNYDPCGSLDCYDRVHWQ